MTIRHYALLTLVGCLQITMRLVILFGVLDIPHIHLKNLREFRNPALLSR